MTRRRRRHYNHGPRAWTTAPRHSPAVSPAIHIQDSVLSAGHAGAANHVHHARAALSVAWCRPRADIRRPARALPLLGPEKSGIGHRHRVRNPASRANPAAALTCSPCCKASARAVLCCARLSAGSAPLRPVAASPGVCTLWPPCWCMARHGCAHVACAPLGHTSGSERARGEDGAARAGSGSARGEGSCGWGARRQPRSRLARVARGQRGLTGSSLE